MSEIPFYRTVMGRRFYESTAPSLVLELARLNVNLERLLAAVERDAGREAHHPEDVPPKEPR